MEGEWICLLKYSFLSVRGRNPRDPVVALRYAADPLPSKFPDLLLKPLSTDHLKRLQACLLEYTMSIVSVQLFCECIAWS
mmetsp:Transcript_474/g.3501  ORF Transcript_474/g.3501 Transcript_474/m.3501 type:complete len:80 (+) Transcript_474:702-941(+)